MQLSDYCSFFSPNIQSLLQKHNSLINLVYKEHPGKKIDVINVSIDANEKCLFVDYDLYTMDADFREDIEIILYNLERESHEMLRSYFCN